MLSRIVSSHQLMRDGTSRSLLSYSPGIGSQRNSALISCDFSWFQNVIFFANFLFFRNISRYSWVEEGNSVFRPELVNEACHKVFSFSVFLQVKLWANPNFWVFWNNLSDINNTAAKILTLIRSTGWTFEFFFEFFRLYEDIFSRH